MAQQSPFNGSPIGYADTVNGVGIALSGVDCGNGVRAGSKCFVASVLQYWTLTVSAAVVDHLTVEAVLNFPGMRWIIDTTGSGGVSSINGQTGPVFFNPVASVANIAALDALDSSAAQGFILGSLVFVQSLGDYFSLRTAAQPVTTVTNRNALNRAGSQWQRINVPNQTWRSQLTWSVDPNNSTGLANDENTGIDDAHPLLTHAECARRVSGAVVPDSATMVVRHLSDDLVALSSAIYNVFATGAPGPNVPVPNGIANVSNFFVIIGIPTVVYSGTMSAVANFASATASDTHFTDLGAPAFSNAQGRLWRKNTGTVSCMWPLKDLGGSTFRTSFSTRIGGGATAIANGDAYDILQLPRIQNVWMANAPQNRMASFQQLDVRAPASSTENWPPGAFTNCDLTSLQLANPRGNFFVQNCRNPFITAGDVSAGTLFIGGGAQLVTTPTSAGLAYVVTGGGCAFQGAALTVNTNVRLQDFAASFYDNAGACITFAGANSRGNLTAITGIGNTGKIVDNTASGCIVTVGAPVLAMTSDAAPFKLNGVSAAALPLVEFATKCNAIVAP